MASLGFILLILNSLYLIFVMYNIISFESFVVLRVILAVFFCYISCS